MSAEGEHSAAGSSGMVLIRSTAEIAEALEAMRAAGSVLTASLQHGAQLFLSRLIHVDPDRRAVIVACSELRAANHALLADASATFSCNHRGVHYEFQAGGAVESEHAGAPAIQLALPEALLALNRRACARFAVPPAVPLRCVVQWGPVSFEAHIVDISRDGIGALVYDAGIRLEPGTCLPRVRIHHPRREVMVALEVRHTRPVILADGKAALRAGCRLIGAHHDLDDLIRLFVTDLEPSGS